MAITYVNDLRLSEMDTGDNSGTWGTVTNTNLELIGEALGFGTEAITTNADTHASTIADGSTDPVRAMYVKYTGTLDSACTITIGPNTVNKFYYIENATSGSQNIIISQGSGANVTIPAGDTKAVYLDGAGSGAAVTDAFASLNVEALTANGGVVFNENGEAAPDFRVESNDFDHMFFINGGLNNTAIGFNALPENQGAGLGILTGSGNGGVHLFREDGSFPSADESLGSFGWSGADSSGSLSTADAKITAFANENMAAGDAGTNIQFFIKADGVNQGTAPTRAMVIASTGQVRFEDGTESIPSISNSGDTNTGMFFPAADKIGLVTGGTERIRLNDIGGVSVTSAAGGHFVLNEGAVDSDFRVETSNSSATFFVDGQYDGVGIHTTSPVSYANAQAVLFIEDDTNPAIAISDTGQSKDYYIVANGSQLGINYADGSNTGSASNVTQIMAFNNVGTASMPTDGAHFTIGGTTAATDANLTLQDPDPAIFFHDSTAGQNDGAIQVANGEMRLLTGANANNVGDLTVQVRIHNGGNLEIDDGNLVIGTAGHGIDFSAQTPSSTGSTSSELLDHYEEGTWSPVLKDGSVGAVITLDQAYGHYTKIGRQVYVNGQVNRNDSTSYTSTLLFTALPFTSAGGTGSLNFNGGFWIDTASATDPIAVAYVDRNTTTAYLKTINQSAAYITSNQMENGRPIYFSFTYIAA